ncbi:MAG: hypothetical protein DF168_01411 [Candidatus Moanabacter tarae]|uniref:Uncharacterized protein n=1 Tax=Candidatus Moanibacter tarae TaxID=2200854 RepID=A0A2Z4AD98_9BACT|nr:MAG: hypothetical protein DF168_01411 [Candidatus Moanabacter tarae]|tara:strand:+ start:2927 stop:3262 length:336 start_codon:yes stop_codon:yes gene_type:complete
MAVFLGNSGVRQKIQFQPQIVKRSIVDTIVEMFSISDTSLGIIAMLISSFDLVMELVQLMRLAVFVNSRVDLLSAGYALALWRVGNRRVMKTRDCPESAHYRRLPVAILLG